MKMIPVCLLVDTSFSMNRVISGGENARVIKTEIHDHKSCQFVSKIIKTKPIRIVMDEVEKQTDFLLDLFKKFSSSGDIQVEVGVITFDDKVHNLLPFESVNEMEKLVFLQNKDRYSEESYLFDAYLRAEEYLNRRVQEYQKSRQEYDNGYIIILSDGEFTDEEEKLVEIARRMKNKTPVAYAYNPTGEKLINENYKRTLGNNVTIIQKVDNESKLNEYFA